MSAPAGRRTWTREELKGLKRPILVQTAKGLNIKAKGKSDYLINKILQLQQNNFADAAPPPEPSPEPPSELPLDPYPEPPPEPSPERLPELSPDPSLEPPEGSPPAQRALSVFKDLGQVMVSPRKADSLASNPSQESVSTHSTHRSLGSNTNHRNDKGKGKETEANDVEQLKGSFGEASSSATNIMVQQTTVLSPLPRKKGLRKTKKRRTTDRKQTTNTLHDAEFPQSQEPNQTGDSQESQHQVQQIVLVSDNSGSSLNLSNSNRTASSDQSLLYASIDSRLKKLETSASMESVRDQVTDLHKDVESLKSDLEKVNNQLSEVQTRNSELQEANTRILQHNAQLQTENVEIRRDNTELRSQLNDWRDRLVLLERRFQGSAPALDSNSPSTDLEGEFVPRLGSPIDEATTPKPDTTPKAALRHLEVASTSEHAGARNSNAPLSLPFFSPLPAPNSGPGAVETRPISQPSSQSPSESRPSPAPGSSHPSAISRKRNREAYQAGLGPSVAPDASVPSRKRVKHISATEEEEEDSTVFQRTALCNEPVQGGFTTPPNPQPENTPSTPALVSRPDYPFNRGSPSPQRRQLPRTLNSSSGRHKVPSPTRPRISSSSSQLITPLLGDATPGAPVQVVAVPVRENDARRTPEPTSGGARTNHAVTSVTLASAVGVFNPPSSSTPARPGSNSLLMRTSASTSRPARGSPPYNRIALVNPPPPLPAISAPGPSAENHAGGGSQSSNGSSSSGEEGANQAPAPAEPVTEPPTPGGRADRVILGMPHNPPAQPSGALDPLRFTGALLPVGSLANPTPTTTPETPDRSVGRAGPETPMASSTRYGTEINASMRHIY